MERGLLNPPDLGIKKREYNGLSIFELVSHPVTHATVCGGAEHQKWTGTFTIDRTEGSYRYGDEVQFVVWSREPPKIKMNRARNGGYYRIEICVPEDKALELLEEATDKIRRKHIETSNEASHEDPQKVADFL